MHRIWEIDNPEALYGTGTEIKGKQIFSTVIAPVGTGSEDLYGNNVVGNEKSRLIRELLGWDHANDIRTGTGVNLISREILRDFPVRNFLEDSLYFRIIVR